MNIAEKIIQAPKIDIYLTRSCNFSCAYCYLSNKAVSHMEMEMIEKIITWIEKSIHSSAICVTFIGGEPLIRRGMLVHAVKRLNDIHTRKGMEIIYNLVTNGYYLDDDIINYLDLNKFFVVFSMDGNRDTQDYCRRLSSGGGTYDQVSKNLSSALKTLKYMTVRMTVHPKCVKYLAENVDYFFQKKVKSLGFIPVYEMNWNTDSLQRLSEELQQVLVTWEKHLSEKKVVLSPLLDYLKELRDNHSPFRYYMHRCQLNIGTRYSIDIDGNIYPCHRFVAQNEDRDKFLLGNVGQTTEKMEREYYFYAEVQKAAENATCNIGCPAVNYNISGDMGIMPISCKNIMNVYRKIVKHFQDNIHLYPNICSIANA